MTGDRDDVIHRPDFGTDVVRRPTFGVRRGQQQGTRDRRRYPYPRCAECRGRDPHKCLTCPKSAVPGDCRCPLREQGEWQQY